MKFIKKMNKRRGDHKINTHTMWKTLRCRELYKDNLIDASKIKHRDHIGQMETRVFLK